MLILIITQEPETQTQGPEADQEIPRPHATTSTLWFPQEASVTVTHFSLPTASLMFVNRVTDASQSLCPLIATLK